MVKGDPPQDDNLFRAFAKSLYATVDAPVTWFRGPLQYFCFCVLCKSYFYVIKLYLYCRKGGRTKSEKISLVPSAVQACAYN